MPGVKNMPATVTTHHDDVTVAGRIDPAPRHSVTIETSLRAGYAWSDVAALIETYAEALEIETLDQTPAVRRPWDVRYDQ